MSAQTKTSLNTSLNDKKGLAIILLTERKSPYSNLSIASYCIFHPGHQCVPNCRWKEALSSSVFGLPHVPVLFGDNEASPSRMPDFLSPQWLH